VRGRFSAIGWATESGKTYAPNLAGEARYDPLSCRCGAFSSGRLCCSVAILYDVQRWAGKVAVVAVVHAHGMAVLTATDPSRLGCHARKRAKRHTRHTALLFKELNCLTYPPHGWVKSNPSDAFEGASKINSHLYDILGDAIFVRRVLFGQAASHDG
jgi:hypothetical protein